MREGGRGYRQMAQAEAKRGAYENKGVCWWGVWAWGVGLGV